MKHVVQVALFQIVCVAPRRGAWIETSMWTVPPAAYIVAPRRGAWIETWPFRKCDRNQGVAPRRGAWIETLKGCLNIVKASSHPAGVRGLKPVPRRLLQPRLPVAPRRGAWIETDDAGGELMVLCVAPRRGAWIETSGSIEKPCG